MKNVQITAVRKEFKNGTSGWEVKAEGMQGKLECKMNFHDGLGSLKAMRYMYLLSKRLDLQINEIQLAAVLLDYRRSKATATEGAENTEAQHTEAESDSDESDTANVEVDKSEEPLTPMMKQFLDLKKKHPDALLLFRCGDFYEAYEDDAEDCAKILGITLTRRNDGSHQRMAGFPYHALDTYLPKLVRAGKRVAICDQIEDPRTKKASKRGITELVKPAKDENKEGA